MIYYSEATKIFYKETAKDGLVRLVSGRSQWEVSDFQDKEDVRKKWKPATKSQLSSIGALK